MMKRIISLWIAAVLLLGLLAGCQAEEGLPLSAGKDLEIRQEYIEYMKWTKTTVDDLSLRAVWYEDGMYALYVDPIVVADALREVHVGESGNKFTFIFPDSQKLYIYKDKTFYTLNGAYAAGILKTEHLESLQKDDVYKNERIPNTVP